MKIWRPFLVVLALLAVPVIAGTIHTWQNGEALTAADLNAVFQHIHNTMVGGHGARLVNADVNASAAISQSKLADYRNFPRAWATVLPSNAVACGVPLSACTFAGNHVTSITGSGNGRFTVLLDYTPTDPTYAVMLSSIGQYQYDGGTAITNGACQLTAIGVGAVNEFNIMCTDLATPTLLTQGFSFSVFDNN